MTDDYNAPDDAMKSYFAAIEAKRLAGWDAVKRDVTIGDCRLLLGDNREILPLLGSFDLCLTDPPYGIGYSAQPIVGKGKKRSNHEKKAWDNQAADLSSVLKCADTLIIWGGNYYDLPPTRGWLSWYKPDAPPSLSHFELAWTSLNRTSRQFSWAIAQTNAERVGHPTQKPLELIKWCLGFAPDARTVVDPFMGSGTTLAACAKRGLRGTGIEIDAGYFDIACERIRKAYAQPDFFVETARVPEPVQEQML